MKNIVSFLLILLAFNISSNAQNVDLSSVDEFLNITTHLKNGEEVIMKQWKFLVKGIIQTFQTTPCKKKDSQLSF